MSKIVTIYIDGKEIRAEEGEILLKTALRNGIKIPNLCFSERTSVTASCRLCIVKIKNINGMVTACTTEVKEGMEVTAFDAELEYSRKVLVDMLLSQHSDDCISCSKDGNCTLQDLAFRYNLERDNRDLAPFWHTVNKEPDFSSPVLDYNPDKCIQCEECIKACREIQGKGILNFEDRGINTSVSTGNNSWDDSDCDGCGECIQYCPVGAITMKSVYSDQINIRENDIESKHTTTCPYCGVGCQLQISLINNQIVKSDGYNCIPNFGSLCVKGRFGLDFVNHSERLKKPLIRKNGELKESEWEEAINLIATKFKEIKEKYGGNSIGGLASARCTNEENFLFQKFIRNVLQTNNVDHCARLCHSSTVSGLATTVGSGAMTNSIEELEKANVILVTGSNTTETHPVIATYIKRAVLYNNAKLIVADPRKIDLVKYSTVWLRQKNGTDVAWINAILNVIIKNNLHDETFITERTEGFEELNSTIKKFTPEYAESISGIPADKLREAAYIYSEAEKASIVFAMGITQHSHGTNNVKSLANLAMITGNVGREGTGINPLRGQNNVQGACDLGALPNVYSGYQKVADTQKRQKFQKAWYSKLPENNGLTVMEMMDKASNKELKAMYIMGENPAISDANANHLHKALDSLDFLVCQDIFLNDTSVYADVVLPACSFAEKNGTYTNTERRILPINKFLEPVGESLSDWEIILKLANAMGYPWNYSSSDDILREINYLTPQYGGITPERLNRGELLQWPCPDSYHPGTKFLHKDKFTRGKGILSAIDYKAPAELPDKKYPFVLTTGRILYHYHTGTMSRRSSSLNEYVKDAYFEMSEEDMKTLNIKDNEKVRVSSRRGVIELFAYRSDRVDKGTIFIPFHFAEAAANRLTNDVLDSTAKIPEYKVCAVNIEKLDSSK